MAATIYSVWRGQAVTRIVDATLQGLGLGDYVPPGDVALADLRYLLETFPGQGQGASGIDFFAGTGARPESARDLALLQSLQSALDLLAGDPFAPAFNHSTSQETTGGAGSTASSSITRWAARSTFRPAAVSRTLAPGLPGLARAGGFGTVDAAAPRRPGGERQRLHVRQRSGPALRGHPPAPGPRLRGGDPRRRAQPACPTSSRSG